MKLFLTFALFFLSLQCFANSTIHVGNGGSGIVKNNVVYLRDLYMAGSEINEHPWIGTTYHSFENFFFSSLENEAFTNIKPLLSRKLTDLDDYHAGFGFALGLAIMNTQWTFVDDPLGTTCDSKDDIIDLEKSGLKPIQIANRFERQVRINRDAWNAMSDVHRAALLLHEALYSLAPKASTQEYCSVPMRFTQRFIGWIFNLQAVVNELPTDIEQFFPFDEIETYKYLIFKKESAARYLSFLMIGLHIDGFPKEQLYSSVNPKLDYSDQAMQKSIFELCQKMKSAQHKSDIQAASLIFVRPPFRLVALNDGFHVQRQVPGFRWPLFTFQEIYNLNLSSAESCYFDMYKRTRMIIDTVNSCGEGCLR